ncbi:MAG: hypothetical protein ACP5QN_02410 [Minisyncoccia bacterium]
MRVFYYKFLYFAGVFVFEIIEFLVFLGMVNIANNVFVPLLEKILNTQIKIFSKMNKDELEEVRKILK